MSSEYGFSGEMSLDMWNSGVDRATRALDRGDVQKALREAMIVAESYQKHRRGTDRWQKITTIFTLIAIAFSVLLGLATGEWVMAVVVVGIIGIVFCGFLYTNIVDKRIAVDNEFYDRYEHLIDVIEDLSRNS